MNESTSETNADRRSKPAKVGTDVQMLHVPSAEEVFSRSGVEVLTPPAIWTRQQADFVVDLSGGSIAHDLQMPKRHELHGTYTACYEEAELFGHHHLHAFVTKGSTFDCQDISGYERRLRFHVTHHPGRNLPMPQITYDGGRFLIDRSKLKSDQLTVISEPAFFGTPIEPMNWGMWLLQAVPAATYFLERRPAAKFLACIEKVWQRELLLTLGLRNDEIIHQSLGCTYRCKSLTALQYSHIDLVPTALDQETFHRIAYKFAPDANITAQRKIFLSRRSITRLSGGKYRALVNEEEVIDAVSALGFEIFEPESLSFSEQIRLFREAGLIVGLGGAALFNTIFCEPGTRVISIESSNSFIHGHATLFASLGLRYAVIFGRQDITDLTEVQKRWSIDVTALAGVLRNL